MSRPVRLALVGCGAVAEHYHLPAIVGTPSCRLVACVDPALERAQGLARRVDATAYASHADLPGLVDAAIVTVPNAAHADVAVDLLRAGISVLVEKPMARTVAECDRMIAAAASTGAVLAVGHDFRFFPVARFARDLFAGGLLGTVHRVDVRQSAGVSWPVHTTGVLTPSAGGGALMTFGVHILDLMLWWFGDLRPLAYSDDASGGVEAECTSEFQADTGATVRFELSRRRSMRDTFVVDCARGSVEIGVHEPAIVRLTPSSSPLPLTGAVVDACVADAPLRAVFRRQLADFALAVEGRQAPLVGGADGRRVVALVEACYGMRRPLRHPWDECAPTHPRCRGSSPAAGDLSRTNVLVIGASGFIGGRLTERLALECGARVRVLVRRVMRASSVARAPIEIVAGDIVNPAAVRSAMDGCAIVFNCVKGKDGDSAARRGVDVDAAAVVVEAAGRVGARVVHLSTMAVYDRPAEGDFDESSAPAPRGDPYTDRKLDGERAALDAGRRCGVPVVVIQPGVVYGPGAGVFGTEILQELRTGRPVLVDGGRGICNAVYIDDLVSALLLAAASDCAAGERFLVAGPGHPTWREFFGAFERMLGVDRTMTLSRSEAHALWRRSRRPAWLASELWRSVRADRALRRRLLATWEGHIARLVADRVLPGTWRARVRGPGSPDPAARASETSLPAVIPLRPWVIDYMARRARVQSTKARRLLGYEPAVGLDSGMRMTEQWARWAGLLQDA